MYYNKEQLDEELKSMPDLLFNMIDDGATKDELVSVIEYTKILIDLKRIVGDYEDSIKKNEKIFLKYALKIDGEGNEIKWHPIMNVLSDSDRRKNHD